MARPNFYCDADALNCILNMEFEGEFRDIELTMDFIDEPYYFIFTPDKEKLTVRAMLRGELYSHTDDGIQKGEAIENRDTGKGDIKAISGLADNMEAFLHGCMKMSYYYQEQNLESVCADFDPEEEGILLYVENGKLKHKIVSGKERPDLMCQTLFGDSVMGRPYMDDFFERSAREEMTLAEKTEAAENGDVDCMNELALLFSNGDDETEANPEKAVYWFRKMAEHGNSTGMYNLGLYYAKGFGVKRDFAQAAYWMEKSAESGDKDAPEFAEEFRKMEECVSKAENGDAQAQADLADELMKLADSPDDSAEKAYLESIKWAKKAADQGNGAGMWILALAYHHGRGVSPDMNIAIDYYKKGAELGNAACMNNLATEYASGDYLDEDSDKAFDLFRASAENGYGPGMQNLGRCYERGYGCDENIEAAVEWYEKALELLDDFKLAQKIRILKMLLNNDPISDDDEDDEEDDFDDDDFEDDVDDEEYDDEDDDDDDDDDDEYVNALRRILGIK